MNRRSFLAFLAAVPFVGKLRASESAHTDFAFDGIASRTYYGHTLAWKGDRLYWSKPHQPTTFDTAIDGDWVAPSLGDPITSVEVREIYVRIRTVSADWRLIGDPDDLTSVVYESGRIERNTFLL